MAIHVYNYSKPELEVANMTLITFEMNNEITRGFFVTYMAPLIIICLIMIAIIIYAQSLSGNNTRQSKRS